MLARIPVRSLPAALRSCARFAVILLAPSLSFSAPAISPYVWPENGAPVCTASGDQHGLVHAIAACDAMNFAWLESGSGPDSVAISSISPIPPTGGCGYYSQAEATAATELSGGIVSGFIIAMPFCTTPTSAYSWLQGSGAERQLVAYVPIWGPSRSRVVVDDGDFVRHHPRLAPAGPGYPDTALVVVWSDERTGVPQIRAQRVNWSGGREWGPSGVLIAPTGAGQAEPEIRRLQNGSSLVIWLDARSGGSDVYALKLLPDGSVAPGWPATGLALESRAEISSDLRLMGAEIYSGVTYALWEESGARFGGGSSIVARKLAIDGTPDPAWDPLGVVLSSSATVEHLQDAVYTGDAVVAVWTDTRAASVSNPTDLYAQRVLDSGAIAGGWPASGLAICTAGGRQDAARVSATYSYAAFAWEDHRGTDADIYAELRYADGTLPLGNWIPNGLPATSAAGDQTAPVVGAGNGGGCFLAWEDARDLGTTGLDIYAQAFSSEGDKLDAPQGPFPPNLSLGAPRPNPMRSETSLLLQSPRTGLLNVDVLDIAGRRVRALVRDEFMLGRRELTFDGRDDAGRVLPPGVYRVRARIGAEVSTRTLIRIQ